MSRQKKRRFNVFSLSFLDVMSCGFGAVVLIFLIINHATEDDAKQLNRDLLSEVRKLDFEIDSGQKDLVDLEKLLEDTKKRVEEARKQLVAIVEDASKQREDLEDLELLTIARTLSIQELQADLDTRNEDVKKLQEMEKDQEGRSIVNIEGQGNRQYLTGLYMGGDHILIALDTSTSMLDKTIVNVLRRRHMSAESKLAAPKWTRAVNTVEWLTAQLPLDSQFQIFSFNTTVSSFFESGNWVDTTDSIAIESAIEKLRLTSPNKGTALIPLFASIAEMDPLPDNIFLIVDGLPTQGVREPKKPTVTGQQRMKLFNEAVRYLPANIPFNIILFPMEGDPLAATAYWNLAQATGGTYMSPSSDWP